MMVVDSSALVAVMAREPEADTFRKILAHSDETLVSVVSVLETSQVMTRWSDLAATSGLDAVLANFQIQVAAVDLDQLNYGREAFLRFGKGRHPAKLNMGDCFAYALAKTNDAQLLFKGDDFSLTDVKRVLIG